MASVFAISLYTADKVQQPAGQRGLAVVNVRDDAEVPDVGGVHARSAGDLFISR